MSPLERRCRLLMRAYPAGYRRERGEEIIATLLEATPQGRRRPLARDARALIIGGLRARAAQHRSLTTAVNLRLAVLAGVCIYLGLDATADLHRFVAGQVDRALPASALGSYGWPALLAGLLTAVAVGVPWLTRRPFAVAASLAAAAATSYGFSYYETTSHLVTQLVCLAAVVALTGGTEHRSPAWLWLIGTVVAALALPGLLPAVTITSHWWEIIASSWVNIALGADLGVAAAAVAWVAIDARPLAAVATYLLLWLVPPMLNKLAAGTDNWYAEPALLVVAAIAALAVWQLRRQSLRPGQAAQQRSARRLMDSAGACPLTGVPARDIAKPLVDEALLAPYCNGRPLPHLTQQLL
jgi:hypothetical protein